MPIVYEILDTPKVVLFSYQGTVTNSQFLAVYKAAYCDPHYVAGMHEISDLQPLSVLDIDLPAIRELATWVAHRPDMKDKTIKVGILYQDKTQQALPKLYAAVSDMYEKETVRMFLDLSDIVAWLALPASDGAKIAAALKALSQR